MTCPTLSSADPNEQQIQAVLQRLVASQSQARHLLEALDIAIAMVHADLGTVQRFNEQDDCLKIVASSGFSDEVLGLLRTVRRNTNSTCAAALSQRMRVFVEDVSTSYLFVSTPKLDMLPAGGVAAAQSTPLICRNGHLWGVLTTHFRKPQRESEFNPAPLDRFAARLADVLEQREKPTRSLNSPIGNS